MKLDEEVAGELAAIFSRASEDQARDALVFLVLIARMNVRGLPALDALMLRFFEDLPPGDPARAIIAYFDARPLPRELVLALRRFSEEVAVKSASRAAEQLERAVAILGQRAAKVAPAEPRRVKPPSSMVRLRAS